MTLSGKRPVLRVYLSILAVLPALLSGCATVSPPAASVQAIERRVQSLEERMARMEARQSQRSDALEKARGAVAYIWGTYTFVDADGRPLRHVLNEVGQPVADPQGEPLVDIRGTGPVAYAHYCGTAFLAGPRGELLTNRHVVQPWWLEKQDEALMQAGLKPVFLILRAFFQERNSSVPIEVLSFDEKADIALARTVDWVPEAAPLELFPAAAAIREAQPVFLLGYPTGLEAVLAKLDDRVKAELGLEGPCSYYTAERLSARGYLKPTATSGFLWEVYPHALVYDARTVGGGSGGPVLDMSGRVLGVNAAYLEEFQGGNYGVPVARGRALLEGGGVRAEEARGEARELQALACEEDPFYTEAGEVCESAADGEGDREETRPPSGREGYAALRR